MVDNNFNNKETSNSSDDQQQQQQDSESLAKAKEEEIKCPSCGALNPTSNLFCNQCGKPFVEKITCPRCGAEVPVFNSFCSYCGAPLKTSSEETVQAAEFSSSQQPSSTESIPQSYWRNDYSQQTQQGQTYYDQVRLAKLETYNTIGKGVGILLIIVGLIGLGFLALMLFTSFTSTFRELVNEQELDVGWGAFYGLLIAMFLVPSSISIAAGTALISYQPENNSWKGFYYSLRYCFLALSGILAIIVLLAVVGWTFYVPKDMVSGALPFWLFATLSIPVDMTTLGLWIIVFLIFLVCLGLLVVPMVQRFIQEGKAKAEEHKNSDELETKLEPSEMSRTEPKEEGEIQLIFENQKGRAKIEQSKGRLPDFFYKLKFNPLIQSLELLGGSYFISYLFILFFVPAETPGVPPIEEQEPFTTLISLGWAGIAEEISFRLIVIGVPMIFVILGRFLLQERGKDKITKGEENHQLKWWDIPLAIRGKFKQIGIPEWILITVSSILFGFAHWDKWTGNWPIWKIFQASIMGFFLSYAFVKYGIESAIFIHCTNNILAGLMVFGDIIGAQWISGFGAFFVFSLLFYGFMKGVSWLINGIKWYQLSKAEKK